MKKIVSVFILFAFVLFGAGCDSKTELDTLPLGGNFSEMDQSGKMVSLFDLKEPILFVFFGYTYCPDFCPNMLSKIKKAEQLLGENERKSVRTVLISIDPERDRPETVQKYVNFYLETATGFSFDRNTTNRIIKQYAAYVEKARDGVMIDHSTYVYVLDKERKTRKLLKSTDSVETFAETVRLLGGNPI
ncbi:SCO family protein [Leptospira idonii]|uniref:SCO family protein n=1 Tax=Leptospira idonii TaxID=1193500 RepID=A0A4R9M1U9_9LEPT|nr:SCO family protein [Leptospira idonii]TGN19249.1 SCO family protein [Leptospira idonii]